MAIFFITLAFFLLMMLALGVGYIVQRKSIAGSCGGLASMGIDKACDCDTPCEKRIAHDQAEAKKAAEIQVKNIES